MYIFCRRGREKFIGAAGVDLWQDYNKIRFLWPGVSSPFLAFSTLKQRIVVISRKWDCFLLLVPRVMPLDYFSGSPNLTYLLNIYREERKITSELRKPTLKAQVLKSTNFYPTRWKVG